MLDMKLFMFGHEKAWNRLLSVPPIEAFALPNPVEQTTPKPTPI